MTWRHSIPRWYNMWFPLKKVQSWYNRNYEKMQPSLKPTMKDELNRLLAACIIFPVHHTQLVANLVPVWKKNGEIRLCINFWNLNRASNKDGYPVPSMEETLQQVSRSKMFSLLYGFLGYNQLLVAPEDRLKTTFRIKWGTYAYKKTPFRLINASTTFQCAMSIAFLGLLGKSIFLYMDDITMFLKKREEHIVHLRQIFDWCHRYGISLNPRKSIFYTIEGNLLGFVVLKDGMMIDVERAKVISKLPPPHNKKSMQSFMGKINLSTGSSLALLKSSNLCKIW